MHKTFKFIVFVMVGLLGGSVAYAQTPAQIKLQCKSPYSSSFGTVTVQSDGNINAVPCPTKTFQINGIPVNPSAISGTTGFVPVFTSGTTIGSSPFRSTASEATFNTWTIDGTRGFGSFVNGGVTYNRFGNAYTYLQSSTVGGIGTSSLFARDVAGTNSAQLSVGQTGALNGTFTSSLLFTANGAGKKYPRLEMLSNVGSSSFIAEADLGKVRLLGTTSGSWVEVDDATGDVNFFVTSNNNSIFDLNAGYFRLYGNDYGVDFIKADDANNELTLGATNVALTTVKGASVDIEAQITRIGNINGAPKSLITVDGNNNKVRLEETNEGAYLEVFSGDIITKPSGGFQAKTDLSNTASEFVVTDGAVTLVKAVQGLGSSLEGGAGQKIDLLENGDGNIVATAGGRQYWKVDGANAALQLGQAGAVDVDVFGNFITTNAITAFRSDSTKVQNSLANATYIEVNPTANTVQLGNQANTGQVLTKSAFHINYTETVPILATQACTKGEIRYNPSYIYICVGTNTWRRATLSTF